MRNPFPGPKPYRSSDRNNFYGRDDLARKLEAIILATRCMTVHGPSGAGKSSLVQAAVLPALVDSRQIRVVRVDAWPEGEAPDAWLAQAIFADLRLGEVPPDISPMDAILNAAKRSARASERLVIIYLDQIEQLFFTHRTAEETNSLFACLYALVELPIRSLRVVLSLREDYLGRFRDRVRDRGRLLENTFRVGPLTVEELTTAVCQAARSGDPAQEWSFDSMRTLMMQVRVPGQSPTNEAEAQAAYAQIVCRALFRERADGRTETDDETKAEKILVRYFDYTLTNLGKLKEPAQRLLSDHFVSEDGTRTLRTEKELLRILPADELSPILKALEGAAILHAEEHQGSRYFEIGHDWLARKVFDEREQRQAQEEARKRAEEAKRELEEQQRVIAERLEKARKERLRLVRLTAGAIGFSAITLVLGVWALRAQNTAEAARRVATKAQLDAVRKRIEAADQRILTGFVALWSQGNPAMAMKLLPEVTFPAQRRGWLSIASDALTENTLRVTLRGHTGPLVTARFSPDGQKILTASSDGSARIWSADGEGKPLVFTGHKDAILSACWSPDGKQILTTSADGTARIWNANGQGTPTVLQLNAGNVWSGAFSPDGSHIALGAQDGTVRIALPNGTTTTALQSSEGNPGGLRAVAFFPDNRRLVGAANNGSVHVWTIEEKDKPIEIGKHDERIESLIISSDGKTVLTTAGDPTAKLFVVQGKTVPKPRLLSCEKGQAIRAALSPDGSLAAITCNDFRVRIFSTTEEKAPVVIDAASAAITDLAFRPDNKFIAVASRDSVARVFAVQGGPVRLELRGHEGSIRTVSFSPNGQFLVTGAADERTRDFSAIVWRMSKLDMLPAPPRNRLPYHALSLRADGEFVAAAYDDNSVLVRRIDGSGSTVELRGHEDWISRIAWAPDGEHIATASFDRSARVWRADGTGNPVVLGGSANDGHSAGVLHVAISADGTLVATASEDRTVKVWHANQAGKPIITLRGHEDWATWVTFSPDGKTVATASRDDNVRLFDLGHSEAIKVFGGHRGKVNSVKFSPDGRYIASASDDGTVRVFPVDGDKPIVLSGTTNGGMSFANWSTNGKSIAAASSYHFVYVWDVFGPAPTSILTPFQPVIALQFRDQDHQLLAALADGSARIWRLDVDEVLKELRDVNRDCLLPRIRMQYLEESTECAQNAFEACESTHGRQAPPIPMVACTENSPVAELARLTLAVDADSQKHAGELPKILGWGKNDPDNKPSPPENARVAQKSLRDLGPEGCRVKVVVKPGDADVEIDGNPVQRQEGAIELLGRKGDVVRMRVSKGGKFMEVEVKLAGDHAEPAQIVLPQPE